MVLKSVLFTLACVMASTSNQEQWQQWKEKTFEKSLTSPTSFLNAYALTQANKGESLYLVTHSDIKESRWVKDKPKSYFAEASHLGDRIRLKINDQTQAYLNIEKKNRRKQFTLPNGAIAEVVYGHRNQKMWTYLYDPKQIKSFTGFRFYPYNLKAVTQGFFKSTERKKIGYKTVQGDPTEVSKIGNVSFKINGVETYLTAYSWQKEAEPMKYFALVFVDQTAGKETYGGGRELVVKVDKPLKDGETVTLDFNKTVNFYCAHSPFWHCPVGLQEPIHTKLRAGEMLPLKKVSAK